MDGVMKWLKYMLYTWGRWVPAKLKDKIDIISKLNIDVYKYRLRMRIPNSNIYSSILIMERILEYDYNTEYVITPTTIIQPLKIIMLYKWYSNNGLIIDDDSWDKWLWLSGELNNRYVYGLTNAIDHISYRNSIKIVPLIKECDDIVSGILDNHRV